MSAAAFASYDGSPRNARLSTASLTQSSWHNHTQHHVYCALCRALLSFQGACCTVYYAFIHVLLRSYHAWAKSRTTTFRHLSSETVSWWYRQPTVPLSRTENSMDDRLLMQQVRAHSPHGHVLFIIYLSFRWKVSWVYVVQARYRLQTEGAILRHPSM
ncbi:hypothetical protein IG631_06841 [Alternaria alternata]|nr:hypothetical protein IG631_06841 [Alternaria alternata]